MPLTEPLRLKILWLFLAVSAFAAIEPSPYEAMFFVCLIAFGRGGLSFDATLAPMIVCLLAFDAAGARRADPLHPANRESVSFTGVSVYITFTTILFATIVARDPLERMKAIRSGYIFAGMLAAILGILGYFNVAGLGAYFTLYDNQRASGPVQGPERVRAVPGRADRLGVPGSAVAARRGRSGKRLMLVVMLLALLLSFSRGARDRRAASRCCLMLAMTF